MAERYGRANARRWTAEEVDDMVWRYLWGQTLKEISEAMGCPLPTVHWNLKRRGVQCRDAKRVNIGRKQSAETVAKRKVANAGFRHTEASRRKQSEKAKARGKNHNWYVDGKGRERTTARKREMDRLEYRLWREAVFERDDWTCQECRVRGGELQADHIEPWRDRPELRYEVSNGRTLCVPCHKKTPTFGSKVLRVRPSWRSSRSATR